MIKALTVAAAIALTTLPANARGFNCGRYMSHVFHLPHQIALALDWARRFPHVSARPGAVVVQRRRGHNSAGGPGGHVSRIIRLTSHCRAIVNDNAGTY